MIKTFNSKKWKSNGEVMWFDNNEDTYDRFLYLYKKLNRDLHINIESISILRDLESVLGKLICTTDIERYESSVKVCMMIANLIYKTTKPYNLTDSQLAMISDYLSYVIKRNCSNEDYIEVSRKLIKIKLNWLTGDKEYR